MCVQITYKVSLQLTDGIKNDVVIVAVVVDTVAAAPSSSSSINCLKIVCCLKRHSRNSYAGTATQSCYQLALLCTLSHWIK